MIDAFFQKLVNLPDLELPTATERQFIQTVNTIVERYSVQVSHDRLYGLSLSSFHDHLRTQLEPSFSTPTMRQLNIFISALEDVIKEIRLFFKLINMAWHEVYPDKQLGGDDVLPLLLCSIPHDRTLLKKLGVKLEFLQKLYGDSYFLNQLETCHVFLSQQFDEKKVDEHGKLTEFQDDFYDKYNLVIQKLSDDESCMQLLSHATIFNDRKQLSKIEQHLLSICQERMDKYFNEIRLILACQDTTTYEFKHNKGMSQDEILSTANEKMSLLKSDLDTGVFKFGSGKRKSSIITTEDNEKTQQDLQKLSERVKKYHAFMDVYYTLTNKDMDLFKRLLTVTKKIDVRMTDFDNELDNIKFTMSPEFCKYLNIPVKTPSLISNLFHPVAVETEVTLRQELKHLSEKLLEFEDVLTTQKERLLSHPNLLKAAAYTNI